MPSAYCLRSWRAICLQELSSCIIIYVIYYYIIILIITLPLIEDWLQNSEKHKTVLNQTVM